MLVVEFKDPAVIGDGVLVALGALADQTLVGQLLHIIAVEGNVGGEAHGQAGGQLAVLPDVLEEGRHVAGTPLGGGTAPGLSGTGSSAVTST